MQRLVTAAEMREMDRVAIEERGIPGSVLMGNAGLGVANSILNHFDVEEGQLVVLLCGKGNNGGDGFVTARLLKEAGANAVTLLVGAREGEVEGDAGEALAAWRAAGGEVQTVLHEEDWSRLRPLVEEADLLVDALLGTGSRGAPRGILGHVISDIDRIDAAKVAVDIPSGLDADTGAVPGPCVDADLTVTMALPKRGHFLHPGRGFVGRLEVVEIGIPDDVLLSGEGVHLNVVEGLDMLVRLPERRGDMHKGDRGRLLVVGGSAGLTGAVALCAAAAVRAGAGLVTAGVPASLLDILETKLTEAMCLPLPELELHRALSAEAFDRIALFQPGRLTALAVGPGAGRHRGTAKLIRRVIEELEIPTVLDADGIHAFAGSADLLRMAAAGGDLILTPHLGEFCALTGEEPETVQADRFGMASRWAQRLGVVLVLKGAPTLIAEPGGDTVYVNPTGNEALATGGTGDVLTGLIAGFLAQGLHPVDAALVGVYCHGMTGDYVCEEFNSPYGLRAGDLVEAFPRALGQMFS